MHNQAKPSQARSAGLDGDSSKRRLCWYITIAPSGGGPTNSACLRSCGTRAICRSSVGSPRRERRRQHLGGGRRRERHNNNAQAGVCMHKKEWHGTRMNGMVRRTSTGHRCCCCSAAEAAKKTVVAHAETNTYIHRCIHACMRVHRIVGHS